ncbi:hypothetical protein [Streptomyces sp. NPDC058953]
MDVEVPVLPDRLDADGAAARRVTRHATASGRGGVCPAGRDQHITER